MQKSIPITDRSSVGEARRTSTTAAHALGFDEQHRHSIGIVVTELANNILLHATSGELLICPVPDRVAWLDILALDNGPGIADVGRAFEDGVSTIGTAGQGLGAIQRLSDVASLYSVPGRGTVVFCRFQLSEQSQTAPIGMVSIPLQGEDVCGDSYLAIPGGSRSLYMVVDGLGHGFGASQAAVEAVKAVKISSHESLTEIMMSTHNALKSTRGAAMSVAMVDHDRLTLKYAGVGNVSASLANGSATRGMPSQNGTLGAILPKIIEYTYPFDPGTHLLMFSDGLTSKCGLGGYQGMQNRPPGLLAGLLYRDFSRKRDDATVLVASLSGGRA